LSRLFIYLVHLSYISRSHTPYILLILLSTIHPYHTFIGHIYSTFPNISYRTVIRSTFSHIFSIIDIVKLIYSFTYLHHSYLPKAIAYIHIGVSSKLLYISRYTVIYHTYHTLPKVSAYFHITRDLSQLDIQVTFICMTYRVLLPLSFTATKDIHDYPIDYLYTAYSLHIAHSIYPSIDYLYIYLLDILLRYILYILHFTAYFHTTRDLSYLSNMYIYTGYLSRLLLYLP
jgi:hypothetical protein